MASSYSMLNDYSNLTLYTPDYNLLQTALQYKQGKLDQNRAKLQQVRDQFGALDVVKDVDQEYLDKRLQKVTEITNRYAGLDLSSDALTNSLIGNMNQVIDDNVKTSVVSTKRLRNEQKEWEEKRKNKPELYNDLNYGFAMQKANKWVNDGVVGSSYSGGGGFIEYKDVNKKIQDALPKAIELIKSKRAQEVSSGQAIGGIATIETVDRGMLSEAIDSMLDEKDRLQLRINAWGQYDNMPDDVLKERFNEIQSPKIKEANSNISTIQAMINQSKSQTEKESLSKTLESWKGRKSELEDLSYENYVGQDGSGRDELYTKIYTDDFKSGFLNAYSYGDRVTELKVNEIQKANKDYQLKLAEYGLSARKLNESIRHNKAMEGYKELDLKLKYGQGEEPGTWKPAGSSEKPIDYKSSTQGGFSAHQNYLASLDKNVRSSLKSRLGTDDKGVEKLMRNREFLTAIKEGNLAGKNQITIAGKTIKLDAGLRKQLIEYSDEFINTPEVKKEVFSDVENMMSRVRSSYRSGINSGNAGTDNLPNYNIKYKKVNGKYTIVKRTENEVSSANRYAYLLKMEKSGKLTESDKRDLKLYSSLHLMNDPTLRPEQASVLKEYIQYSLLGDVDQNGYKNVSLKTSNSFGALIPNSVTKSGAKDIWISNIGAGDIKGNAVTNMFESAIGTAKGALGIIDVSDFTKGSPDELDVVIKDEFNNIDAKLNKVYSPKKSLIEMGKVTLSKTTNEKEYKRIAGDLGWDVTGEGRNNNLFIEPDVVNGKPTGKFVIYRPYTKTSGKDPRKADRAVKTEQEIRELGIPELVGMKRDKFNANEGIAAKKLNLGNGIYTEDGWDAGLNEQYRRELLGKASEVPEILSETKRILADYKRGDLQMRLEPVNMGGNNIYAYRLYRGDKVALKGIPFQATEDPYMKESGVDDILENPKPFVDFAFYNILSQYQNYLYND